MKKNLLLLSGILLCCLYLTGQDIKSYLKENAVKFNRPDSLGDEIYELLSAYKLIMIGEMHGTKEPVGLLKGLTDLLTRHGDSVEVGFEIASNQVNNFLEDKSDSILVHSDFFTNTPDGRNSTAWLETILSLKNNTRVHLFFYDTNHEYSNARDSEMYVNIRTEIMLHPGWKTITISGNIHNMFLPYKGIAKTANFLRNDSVLNFYDKICSLNHFYQTGTMFNMMNNKLEIHEVDYPPSEYSTAVEYENYIVVFPYNVSDNYSGIFFTKHITASEPINKN
ncbi:MAG: hypothetical protein ABI763_13160 [Bacteroidota bacterium]